MKAIYLEKVNQLIEKDIPKPEINDNEVLIKVSSVGVCGSDVHYWQHGKIGSFIVKEPIILGHEVSGIIVDKGKNVSGLRNGDLVVIEPGKTCGQCKYCKSGRYNLCADIEFFATPPYDGALCEYVAFDSSYVFKVPEGINSQVATLVEPLAVGTFATNKVNVKLGDKVIIYGAGVIGLCCMIAAKEAGAAQVCVVDIKENRLKMAKKLGADEIVNAKTQKPKEKYYNKAYECTGAEASLMSATVSVVRGGDIVLIGMGAESTQKAPIVEMIINEQRLIPVFRYANAFEAALQVISNNKEKFSQMITHNFHFVETEKAFLTARDDEDAIKVIINI